MAEIELSALSKQCLDRRIADIKSRAESMSSNKICIMHLFLTQIQFFKI